MRTSATGIGTLALAAAGTLAASRPLPVPDVMSAPFASLLTAAPAGGALAWVLKQDGARNVWVAEPREYAGRRLTSYAGDDGQELAALEFTPDGRALVYVRGGGPNRGGEIPNPLSDPAGATQAIWLVPLSGGEPRKLADGAAPAVSPRGDGVAFVKAGQVWSVPLVQGEAAQLQLVKARGTARALRWSPDGSKLAFTSDRGDHAFVGVYDTVAKAIRWLDASVDRDIAPAWSPDGSSVAFVRQPASPRAIGFVPQREGTPWSIRVADAASGRGREVFRAKPGRGGRNR